MKRPITAKPRAVVQAISVLSLLVPASRAVAQDVATQSNPSPAATDDIVVTARSGAESLQMVPVSVSALSNATLDRYSSTDLTKIGQVTPQVQINTGGSGSGAAILIRGIGTTADNVGVDQSVSLAIDGFQLGRARTVIGGMFDTQQVEILKGPQALFFGKNSSAGVISVKTANPTDTFQAQVKGGYEFEARERYVEAAIGGPVSDTLKIRFAGRYSKLRGWVRNASYNVQTPYADADGSTVVLPGGSHQWGPGSRDLGGRVTILFQPSSNYSSTVKGQFTSYDDNGVSSVIETVCRGIAHPTTDGLSDPRGDCSVNGVNSVTDLPPRYTALVEGDPRWRSGVPYTHLTSMLLTWHQSLDLGSLSILSNSAYTKMDMSQRSNFNFTSVAPTWSGGSSEYTHAFSQELRAITNFNGPFNVTVGGYYEDFHGRYDNPLFLFNAGPDPVTGSYQTGFKNAFEHDRVISFFGQARWAILENLELAGGARWTETKKDVSQGQVYVNEAASTFLFKGLISNGINEHNVSPEVTLSWHPEHDSTLYAAFKTGYKGGGISQPALVTLADIANGGAGLLFKPEKVIGGEVGYKTRMFDRRLRLDLTAYYYVFKALQQTAFDQTSATYRFLNAADAHQRGIEGNLEFAASDQLSLRAAFGYNRLTYGSYTNAACYSFQTEAEGCVDGTQDLTGRQLHRAPTFAGSIGFSYDQPVSDALKLSLSSDVIYSGGYYGTEALDPVGYQHKYALVNTTLRLSNEASKWELALIGRNLTNQYLFGFSSAKAGGGPGENSFVAQRPREIALQATVRF